MVKKSIDRNEGGFVFNTVASGFDLVDYVGDSIANVINKMWNKDKRERDVEGFDVGLVGVFVLFGGLSDGALSAVLSGLAISMGVAMDVAFGRGKKS